MIKFETQCIFCGSADPRPDYTCDCRQEEWTNEYRVLKIRLKGDDLKKMIQSSFENYDPAHPDGMYQYKGLPNLDEKESLPQAVGGTGLFKLPVMPEDPQIELYIKNEGDNPSGCFKDRETVSCLLNSKKNDLNKAVIYSSGNAAASAALLSQFADIELVVFVPGDTYPEKINYITDHGADVIKIGDENTGFEEGYRIYAKMAADGYFLQNGYDDWSVRNPYRVEGDKTMAVEICKQLGKLKDKDAVVPDFVIVPTANGSCLAGIWKGFKELKEAAVIYSLPKMVSVGIEEGSPVYKAVEEQVKGEPVKRSLDEVDEKDAEMGSIILAEEGYDSIEAAKAVRESEGYAFELSAEDIKEFYDKLISDSKLLLNRYDLLPEPASVLSIAAIPHLRDKLEKAGEQLIVSVITGHGMKARNKVEDLIDDDEKINEIVDPLILRKKNSTPPKALKRGKVLNATVDMEDIKTTFEDLIVEH